MQIPGKPFFLEGFNDTWGTGDFLVESPTADGMSSFTGSREQQQVSTKIRAETSVIKAHGGGWGFVQDLQGGPLSIRNWGYKPYKWEKIYLGCPYHDEHSWATLMTSFPTKWRVNEQRGWGWAPTSLQFSGKKHQATKNIKDTLRVKLT